MKETTTSLLFLTVSRSTDSPSPPTCKVHWQGGCEGIGSTAGFGKQKQASCGHKTCQIAYRSYNVGSGRVGLSGPILLVVFDLRFFLADVPTRKEILHTFRAVKMHYRVLTQWSVFRAHETRRLTSCEREVDAALG
jgi:hypothetical protein